MFRSEWMNYRSLSRRKKQRKDPTRPGLIFREVGQNRPQLSFRSFVILVHGQSQRFFQGFTGLFCLAELKVTFAEQNEWHLPFRFFSATSFQMFNCFTMKAFVKK
jgi:hypothetical protein